MEGRGCPSGIATEVDCIPALKAYCSEKTKRLFVDNGILSERELEARFEIKNEIYLKKLQIESRVLGSRVESYYPDGDHLSEHAVDECDRFEEYPAGLRVRGRRANRGIRTISYHIREIQTMVSDMTEARKQANAIADEVVRAEEYTEKVRPYLEKIRYHVDKLELLVDDEIWPLPKYRELLFSR